MRTVRFRLFLFCFCVLLALLPVRSAEPTPRRAFVYLYDADGALIGARVQGGLFADSFTVAVPAREDNFGRFSTQALSFSVRHRRVVIATGTSMTTVLVGANTGRPMPLPYPFSTTVVAVTPVDRALLLNSCEVVETATQTFVYAQDRDADLPPGGQGENVYAFRLLPNGRLQLIARYATGGDFAFGGITHVGNHLVVASVFDVDDADVSAITIFEIQRDGSLVRKDPSWIAGVDTPNLFSVNPRLPFIYAPDCGDAPGGIAGFRLDPGSGSLQALSPTPFETDSEDPCNLTVRPGVAVSRAPGGGDTPRGLQTFRLDSQGVLVKQPLVPNLIRSGTQYEMGVFTSQTDPNAPMLAAFLNPAGNLLEIRSLRIDALARPSAPFRITARTTGTNLGLKGSASGGGTVFSNVFGFLRGGLVEYEIPRQPDQGEALWVLRGITFWVP